MMRRTALRAAGVSGMSVFAPPARVDLKDWCDWTGNKWDKVSSVVGQSFRVPSANENAYTMAATAALRLILENDIDPRSVGFLGLGTESSTDNSAGAVIVRGMLDKALDQMGLARLSRHCEVPEFKHACLGGIYALKSACRYVDTDGKGRVAIVMSSDIAEYARGSTGEQTQGAGAVAMLVESTPRLFEIDLVHAGNGSAYRGPDFRKPTKRHFMESYGSNATADKIPDFPVFSGPYSTMAYLEEVTVAVESMLDRLNRRPSDYYNSVDALFFHRPYHMMPVQAMSFLYARGLARSTSTVNRERFAKLCQAAKVSEESVRAELAPSVDLFSLIEKGQSNVDPAKCTNNLAKIIRADPEFLALLQKKMSLGSSTMANFGNLYTASLPCWLAAGFDEAYQKKLTLDGPMVMVGYGSGDASEAIPIHAVPGWEKQAQHIKIDKALAAQVNLTKAQYDGLHSGSLKEDVGKDHRKGQFVIGRIGERNEAAFQDIGIEYYTYLPL